ncbi:hypothetical protein HDV02_003117 [Globomyces sp. JEL0801]|nr:hypothetical protein HDV02_003117 [Globomyces sp. JEL0801]
MNSKVQVNPGPLDYLTVGWLTPLIKQGYKKPITQEDLYELADKDKAEALSNKFDGFWKQYRKHIASPTEVKRPKLIWTFMRMILGPELINLSLALAFLLFAIQIGSACMMSLESMTARRMSQIVNSAMIGAIYEKSLRLNLKSRQEFSEGKIMNLVNQDVNTIISTIGVVDGLIVLPFQFISTIFLLYNLIGTSCFASIGIMVFIAIYTSIISPNVGKYYSKWIRDADTRIKALREFLYGIKVVKFRAIEDYFRKRINDARSTQLHSLKMFNVVLASLQISVGASTMVMVVVSLSIYSYLGNEMDVAIIFPAIMYFDALGTPFNTMTFAVSSAVSGAKSMNRVQEFLCAEELDPSETSVVESELVAIKLKDVTWKWEDVESEGSKVETAQNGYIPLATEEAESDVNTDTFSLKSLNLEIEKGSLIGIVGAVGAGKSTLLSSLIGETNRMGGEVAVSGKLAYCPQQPWILTGSVEKNILFNQPLDQDRMNEVANVCGLSSDLKVFSDGFKTEIGESGVNVSGGQKSRLGLARALYSGSDIYLLDDPLAALDAHVGKNVFADAIKGYLGDKTVLLVTHQLQFLQQVDKVLVLQDGHISEFGKFDDLVNKPNGTLKKMMESYKLETEEEAESVETTTEESEVVGKKEDAQNFIAAEEKNEGGIKFDVYKRYFAAMGHPFFPFLQIFMTLMMLVVLIIQPFWLVYWSKAEDQATNLYYLYVYAFLGFLYVVAYGNVFLVIYHKLAMEGLYRAPLYFFEQNPIGRIINRLISDVRGLDRSLASVVLNLSLSFARLTSTLILASQSTYYILPSNVELKRLQSIQKSPLDAHINETLSGLASVRAFKQQYQFVQTQRKLMDEYLVSVYMYFSLSVWFSFRMKILSTFVTLFISLVASQSKDSSSDFAAAVGIALTSASGLTSLVSNLLNQLGQVEAEANAVERLDYYAYSLPKEGDLHLDTDPCVEEWPSNGEMEIKDLELCYQSRPDFAVIKELSFKMKAGEKVGVVGRTGSGKSTLVSAFFRILEPTKGNIILDGQDISKLGLATLRRRIQMIPQDPVLFQGTFRTNLDFSGEFTDEQLWESLEYSGLKPYVSELTEKLDSPITANGDNLSVGQRQLVCLSRSILMKPKFLVMDEATAAIDGDSDKLIQKAIKEHFSKTTIISIAHRLNTIADFDRVLVLDAGRMVEYDAPYTLLQKPDSLFSQLVDATGTANAELLRDIATKKYKSELLVDI